MGSHSRRHHHHCSTPVSSAYCCSGGCCNESSSHGSPIDPLLVQSIAAALQQQQQQNQCVNPCCFQPGGRNCSGKDHWQTPFHSRTQTLHSGVQPHKEPTQFLIASLLQRLDALESSLRQLSSTCADEYPLRDAAARVIQARFRAFLVRRSSTLRQLKHLASLKSAFNSLADSISWKSSYNFELVSQKAMDLLLKLDSVQGGDPMIRDAKRSMSKDLVRFLELVDNSRKRTVLYKAARKVRPVGCGNKSGARNVSNGYGDASTNQREIVEKLRHRVGKINDGLSRMSKNDEEGVDFEGFQYDLIDEDDGIVEEEEDHHKVIWKPKNKIGSSEQPPRVKKKSVSFAEDENVYTVLVESPGNGRNSFSPNDDYDDEDDDDFVEHYSDDEVEATTLETDDQNEEAPSSRGRLLATQKGKNHGRSNVKASGAMQEDDGSFFFSAPVPAKMESRAPHSTNANNAAKNVS